MVSIYECIEYRIVRFIWFLFCVFAITTKDNLTTYIYIHTNMSVPNEQKSVFDSISDTFKTAENIFANATSSASNQSTPTGQSATPVGGKRRSKNRKTLRKAKRKRMRNRKTMRK